MRALTATHGQQRKQGACNVPPALEAVADSGEILWLEAWLKKEKKRDWVPWLKPIIAQNEKRLAN
jgi:hypothetical protein